MAAVEVAAAAVVTLAVLVVVIAVAVAVVVVFTLATFASIKLYFRHDLASQEQQQATTSTIQQH